MFGSFIEPGNGQQAIEPNDVDQMNTNGANAIDGQNIDNDISCESLPPSPIRNVVYRDQVKKRKIEVTPKKKPVVLPSVRGNNHTPPKVVNGALSVSQVDNGIPATPLHNRRALSWQDNLDDSQLTDDNNNSPIADNNRMTTQPEPNDDIIPETPISVHNTPVQPVDDVPIVSLTADENVIPAPNEEDANLSPPVNLEPLDDINPQTPVNNIQVQPDDDVPMTPINSIPNADEIVVPSPVKSEPIDIEPPVIPPKRKRRSAPKKKKKTLCVDDVIMLDVAEMRARIENLTVDCKQPQADIISKTDILLRKEATFFTVPTIDGEVNRELFKRNLVQTDAENDLSIIDAILGIPENGQSELDDNSNSGRESQVIQGDQLRRRSSRKRKSPDVEPRIQHEPIEMPIPEQTAHPTPVEPMDGIESQLLPNLSGMHISLPDEQSVEQPVRPKRSPSPADDTLNENDKMVMRKLRALWKRNDHPVTMTSITERKSSRLQAAKNFASILSKFDSLDSCVCLFVQLIKSNFACSFCSSQETAIGRGGSGRKRTNPTHCQSQCTRFTKYLMKYFDCSEVDNLSSTRICNIYVLCPHTRDCVCVCCLQFILTYK